VTGVGALAAASAGAMRAAPARRYKVSMSTREFIDRVESGS